jgi:hypothetical protein
LLSRVVKIDEIESRVNGGNGVLTTPSGMNVPSAQA